MCKEAEWCSNLCTIETSILHKVPVFLCLYDTGKCKRALGWFMKASVLPIGDWLVISKSSFVIVNATSMLRVVDWYMSSIVRGTGNCFNPFVLLSNSLGRFETCISLVKRYRKVWMTCLFIITQCQCSGQSCAEIRKLKCSARVGGHNFARIMQQSLKSASWSWDTLETASARRTHASLLTDQHLQTWLKVKWPHFSLASSFSNWKDSTFYKHCVMIQQQQQTMEHKVKHLDPKNGSCHCTKRRTERDIAGLIAWLWQISSTECCSLCQSSLNLHLVTFELHF